MAQNVNSREKRVETDLNGSTNSPVETDLNGSTARISTMNKLRRIVWAMRIPQTGPDADPPVPYRQELGKGGSAVIAKWEGVREKPYVPVGANSGVTIGIGYDMGSRTATEVVRDLMAAGVDRETATALAKASGLKGKTAKEHLKAQKVDLKIGMEQAEKLFRQVANAHANNVRRLVKVPLSQNQFDALVSLDYNAWLEPKSSIIRTLNSNTKTSYAEAADQFRLYNKIKARDSKGKTIYRVSKGLVNRREDERTLFLAPG